MRISWSLSNRIFLATALMAILSIGLAIFVVNVAVTRQAENELQRGLEDSATAVEQYRDLLLEQFAREARLIADLPKLKAAVGVDHPPTVRPIAADYQRQIGSDLFVVTDADGAILAQIGRVDLPAGHVSRMPTIQAALAGRATASFWPRAGGDIQVVTIPIWIDPTQPELLGTLTVGFALDERLAVRFKDLTASDIAFVVDGSVQATTLSAEHASAIAAIAPGTAGARIRLGDEEYVAVTRRLSMDGEWSAAGADDDSLRAPPGGRSAVPDQGARVSRAVADGAGRHGAAGSAGGHRAQLRRGPHRNPAGRRHHRDHARDGEHRRSDQEDRLARSWTAGLTKTHGS